MQTGTITWKIIIFAMILLLSFAIVVSAQTSKQLIKFKGDEEDQQDFPELFEYENQYGQPSKELLRWYWLQVVDENGAAVPNFPVTFTVTKGGGSIRPSRVNVSDFIDGDISVVIYTDEEGLARAKLTLGLDYLAENTVVVTADENGTILNGAPITFRAYALEQPSTFEKSLSLNGEQQYLEIPDAPFMDVFSLKELTVEMLFKPRTMHYFSIMNKINKYGDTAQGVRIYNGWAIDFNRSLYRYYNSGAVVMPNMFSVYVGKAEENSFGYTTWGNEIREDSTAGEWIHLAIVQKWIENTSEVLYSVYINGNERLRSDSRHVHSTQGSPLILGGLLPHIHEAIGMPNDLYFDGLIDEVRIWDYAKKRDELVNNITTLLGEEYYSTADSGLVGYYRFEQLENLGVGGDGLLNDIRDLSTSANHANTVGDVEVVLAKTTSVDKNNLNMPDNFKVLKNYPNPFNPTTTIAYKVTRNSQVSLKVYDVLGREIDQLVDDFQGPGNYEVKWNGKYNASGIYFVRLNIEGQVHTLKMLLEK